MADDENEGKQSLPESSECNKTETDGASYVPEKVSEPESEWACKHYKRNCSLQAKCCGKFYPCRFCHDEDNFHEMDRHTVDQIRCIKCESVQDVAQNCTSCDTVFGEYFCAICRLFDVNNNQFHCDKCGICRVGPKDNFYHCNTCNACLCKELEGNHKCLDNISMSPCPICRELLHTSRMRMHIPRCGHMIHQDCLRSYYKQGQYKCPLCKESLEDMSEVWKQMDQVCSETRMPEELADLNIKILCQDCHEQCDQKFNTEGLKCVNCGSYNTTPV